MDSIFGLANSSRQASHVSACAVDCLLKPLSPSALSEVPVCWMASLLPAILKPDNDERIAPLLFLALRFEVWLLALRAVIVSACRPVFEEGLALELTGWTSLFKLWVEPFRRVELCKHWVWQGRAELNTLRFTSLSSPQSSSHPFFSSSTLSFF